ncbi:MAG TPA: polysaccharide deacetylase family protein [Candidatus Methanoperedens sp.]|nr:polysaccharide deacetylase family protein [Candidatus Methanoperedens sp.]
MLLRQAVKTLLLPLAPFLRERRAGVTLLLYHRVSGDLGLELDLAAPVFERQLRHLCARRLVVSLEEGLALLQGAGPLAHDRCVLTFDDGYADLFEAVFPLLAGLRLPATVYVTTGFVEGRAHSPLSGPLPDGVRPLTWTMLREMHASGLVTVGAHSHAHREYVGLDAREVAEDIARSDALFARHLGFVPQHFAYPRARFDAVAESVVRRRYASAAVGGGAKAVPGACDPHRLPRVPVRRSDGMLFFAAKVRGLLAGEERLAAWARAARRR